MANRLEQEMDEYNQGLLPSWELDIFPSIRKIAERMKVEPAHLNLAINYVSLGDPRPLIRDLLLLSKYLELCNNEE